MGAHLQIAFISGFENDIVKLEFDPSGAKLGQQCWKTYDTRKILGYPFRLLLPGWNDRVTASLFFLQESNMTLYMLCFLE